MNDVTFSQLVTLEAETNTGAIEMRVLDKIIELNRDELNEFLVRTEPAIKLAAPSAARSPQST